MTEKTREKVQLGFLALVIIIMLLFLNHVFNNL